MELTIIAVLGVISIVAVAALSRRIGVAAPLSLVMVGLVLSFMPGLPHIEIEPEIILTVVLPPLLYAAAVHMPAIDFRRDFKAIFRLSVVLVAVTTLCSGYLFAWLIPGLGLAAAFALGAVISPTDAVAATSVGKKLGLPSRLTTILEGEGLVNDASSLVLLASAVSALHTSVPLWRVGTDFAVAVVIAVLVGAFVGLASVFVRSRLTDTVANTALSFVVPFLAFLPAEELGASGVLAVVVAGLVNGNLSPRFIRARDRLAENTNWMTISFLLESAIFLLMGLQLRTLLDQTDDAHLPVAGTIGIGLLAALLAIAIRALFVAPLVSSLRHDADRAESYRSVFDDLADQLARGELPRRFDRGPGKKDPERLRKRLDQRKRDNEFFINERFGWRGGVVIAWSGMRGAVTVAAAQTLPPDTPFRPQLLLIAFIVAVTTLLLQGLTLPWVIKKVRVPADDTSADRAAYVELLEDLSQRAAEVLDDPGLARPDGTPFEPVVVARVREETAVRRVPPTGTVPDDVDPREQYRELSLLVLSAEQDELLRVRSMGAYSSRLLTFAQDRMDRRLAQFQQAEA
ncbi:cation:proton antiporter [Nonomuraea soli]|uniref:CPA1 family monovalent cation:H+ antiporter n=1 Tax=Nonomuraea soli TaxID=1032476 RepID=A0A7W0CGV3_9ACTN|nr:cation:proton antiporter [Nonomuraea soli]MBA2890789.1 CPA1 family monovalent cation:H+ antiporter [Nonomuraea soli]